MHFNPIGDLAKNLMMRREGSSLRSELSKLTAELSTGKTRDLAASVRGNFSTISAVEHSLEMQSAYSTNRKTVDQILETSQLALQAIQGAVDEIGPSLLTSAASGNEMQVAPYISQGPDLFRDIVSFTNTQSAGRFIFSGVAVDTKPLADADLMLSDIAAHTTGTNTAASFSAAIDDWFNNSTTGFNATGYMGGDPSGAALEISSSRSISLETTAQTEGIKNALKHAATLALIQSGDFIGSPTEKMELLKKTGSGMMTASAGLIAIQAEIGASQQRNSTTAEQASLEVQMLEKIKSEIVTVDPYEIATKLEAVQTQLEGLYLVTARTSRLNLSEYLR